MRTPSSPLFCPGRDYLISCAFIISGLISVAQICAIPIPFTKGKLMIGTGLLSLVGVSAAYIALIRSQIAIQLKMYPEMTWVQAYGGVIGALMVSSVAGMLLAGLPSRVLQRLLPPVVSGLTVVLIGASLADLCLAFWGGGPGCSAYSRIPSCQVLDPTTGAPPPTLPPSIIPSIYTYLNDFLILGALYSPPNTPPLSRGRLELLFLLPPAYSPLSLICFLLSAGEYVPSSNCYMAPGTIPCTGNGDVELPYGNAALHDMAL